MATKWVANRSDEAGPPHDSTRACETIRHRSTMDDAEPSEAAAASELIRRMNAASASQLAAELRSGAANSGADVRPIGSEPMHVDSQRQADGGLPSEPAQRLHDRRGGRRSLELLQVLDGHTDRVWAVAWSPNGERALQGTL